jgi:guanylate kinase
MIHFIVVIGPSAAGKSTIKNRLGYSTVTTWTSRLPREGEKHGIDYFFATREEMLKRMGSGFFLEMTEYDGNYYATSLQSLESIVQKKKTVTLAVDLHGIEELKRHFGERVFALGLYISKESCRVRLEERGEGGVEKRLKNYEDEIMGVLAHSDLIINNEKERWGRIPLLLDGVRAMVKDSMEE